MVVVNELATIAFENVAVTVVVRGTPVAPAAGVRAVIVGGGGGAPAVVNDQLLAVPICVPSEPRIVPSRRAV